MKHEIPFWDSGIHPITGKYERNKILTEDQKQRARELRVDRKNKMKCG